MPDPTKLRGLQQASYVLHCLHKGMTDDDVAAKFGDKQLAKMWIFFLLHNHCIEKTMNASGDYVYSLTQKGREWIEMYSHNHGL